MSKKGASFSVRKSKCKFENGKVFMEVHGGSVCVKANREGSAHSPVYTAIAELHGMLAEGQGCTKKKAEQLASEMVLAQCSM